MCEGTFNKSQQLATKDLTRLLMTRLLFVLQEIAKIEDEFTQSCIRIQLRDGVAELPVFVHELIDDRRAFRH